MVSVVIPTYNRASIVSMAIDSVLAQTYRDLEVIVVDDGSTDETPALLAAYGDRIRVLRQENAGPAIARNRGIAAARGELVAFLDSDDTWLPRKLERQVALLDRVGDAVPCCLCNCQVQYQDGSTTSTFTIADTIPSCAEGVWLNPAAVLLTRFVLFNQAVLIRRSALEQAGAFDEKLRFAEDYDLPLRLALAGPWAILADNLVIYHASSHDSWAARALREGVRLHEDLLTMRRQIGLVIQSDQRYSGLRGLADHEYRRAQRALHIARLRSQGSGAALLLGRGLGFVERMRRAAFRRTPVYPRMRVQEAA